MGKDYECVQQKRCTLVVVGLLFLAAHAAADEFVGSENCARCHKKESKAWRNSPHGRQATAVATPEEGADFSVGSRWVQAYLRRDETGHHRIASRSFDIRKEAWRDTREVLTEIQGPTPDGTKHVGPSPLAHRSFEIECSGCHTSQARIRIDLATGKMDARWTELDINCETCHGPGRAHAEAWDRLDASQPMPKLGEFDARASTAVCARCHGGPVAPGDFAPADAAHFVGLLEDRHSFFPDGSSSGQSYQHAAFVRSRCHTEGDLTCNSCHEAHGPGLRHRAHPDAMCTRCHEGYAARSHTFHDPRKDGARCVSCHMPRLLSGIMAHQRDHRIASPLPASPHAPDACTACHEGKSKAWSDRAYRERWGDPPHATLEAIDAIRLARAGSPDARPLLRSALRHRDPFFRANAVGYLGDGKLVREDPSPEVRMVAVLAGEAPWALEDPHPTIRGMAFVMQIRKGMPAVRSMQPYLATAARQMRNLPAAHTALGFWCVDDGDAAAGREHFEAALGFRPRMPAAWNGLALACDQLHQKEDAQLARVKLADIRAEVLERRPWDLDAARAAASAYVAAGQPGRAREVVARALSRVRGPVRRQLLQMLEWLEKNQPEEEK